MVIFFSYFYLDVISIFDFNLRIFFFFRFFNIFVGSLLILSNQKITRAVVITPYVVVSSWRQAKKLNRLATSLTKIAGSVNSRRQVFDWIWQIRNTVKAVDKSYTHKRFSSPELFVSFSRWDLARANAALGNYNNEEVMWNSTLWSLNSAYMNSYPCSPGRG